MQTSEWQPHKLWTLEHSSLGEQLAPFERPWEALSQIEGWIWAKIEQLEAESTKGEGEYLEYAPHVWVHKSVKIAKTAEVLGPTIIEEGTEVRPSAFIRGKAYVGKHCVVGNSSELKNVILFDRVQVPHFNYVGDSILGYKAHMGAGSVTSNVKADKSLVSILLPSGERLETSCKKFGALLGDFAEIGCNAVLNPGTVVGAHSVVYPLTSVRGLVPANHICKSQTERVVKKQAE